MNAICLGHIIGYCLYHHPLISLDLLYISFHLLLTSLQVHKTLCCWFPAITFPWCNTNVDWVFAVFYWTHIMVSRFSENQCAGRDKICLAHAHSTSRHHTSWFVWIVKDALRFKSTLGFFFKVRWLLLTFNRSLQKCKCVCIYLIHWRHIWSLSLQQRW